MYISGEWGIYQALLAGFVLPPKAVGPIKCGAGKPTPIDFRNPFPNAVDFHIQVDNPAFVLQAATQKIDSYAATKKAGQINVTYQAGQGAAGGRILVTCAGVRTPWVFFLEGE